MSSAASPLSKASAISPSRSIVILALVTTSVLFTGISTLNASKSAPGFLMIALQMTFLGAYLIAIIGLNVIIRTDQTDVYIDTHYSISALLIFVLCLSKAIERDGIKNFTREDVNFCAKLVIWTITFGMSSAIWLGGGVEALKCEAKAVPGNLWLVLYGPSRAEAMAEGLETRSFPLFG